MQHDIVQDFLTPDSSLLFRYNFIICPFCFRKTSYTQCSGEQKFIFWSNEHIGIIEYLALKGTVSASNYLINYTNGVVTVDVKNPITERWWSVKHRRQKQPDACLSWLIDDVGLRKKACAHKLIRSYWTLDVSVITANPDTWPSNVTVCDPFLRISPAFT